MHGFTTELEEGEGVRCWKRAVLERTSLEFKGVNPQDYAAATVRN